MKYRQYISALVATPEIRALGGTYLYGTSYDLFTEYMTETSTANVYSRRFGIDFSGQKEMEFYILLDFFSFVPFGDTGRAYLNAKGVLAKEHAYARALLLLERADASLDSEEKARLHRFFTTREDSVLPCDPVGLAVAARRLGDRLFEGVALGKCAGSLGKARELGRLLKEIAERVFEKELTEFDIAPILSALPKIEALNATQTEHLEAAASTLKFI